MNVVNKKLSLFIYNKINVYIYRAIWNIVARLKKMSTLSISFNKTHSIKLWWNEYVKTIIHKKKRQKKRLNPKIKIKQKKIQIQKYKNTNTATHTHIQTKTNKKQQHKRTIFCGNCTFQIYFVPLNTISCFFHGSW